jgi:hypothetical protein
LQGAEAEEQCGVAMTVEGKHFDCCAFSTRDPLNVRTDLSTFRSYAAIKDL